MRHNVACYHSLRNRTASNPGGSGGVQSRCLILLKTMSAPARLPRSFTRLVVTIGAYLAIVAQLSVACASVAEARDGQGMGAHVEQSGTSLHYAHSDVCALCQVRSL